MKYDLKAMEFDPDVTDVGLMFSWLNTPEGHGYWHNYSRSPHQEGRDKIVAMLKQWKEEQAVTELPAINVLHKHDGSDESPLPKGTDHTFWLRDKTVDRQIDRSSSQGGISPRRRNHPRPRGTRMSRFTRKEIWQHNSYFGHAAMARKNMHSIQRGKTATEVSKALARQIEKLSRQLTVSLKTRIDMVDEPGD